MRLLAVVVALALVALPAGAEARKRHRTMLAKVNKPRAKAPVRWGFAATPFAPVAAAPAATPVPSGVVPGATPPPSATPTPAPTTVPPSNPHSVSVRGTEYALTLSQKTVDPGALKVQFDLGRAEDAHSLSIDGVGGDGVDDYWSFDEQEAGTVVQHTITVRSGSYVLFCPLPQHEALGMRTTLTVR